MAKDTVTDSPAFTRGFAKGMGIDSDVSSPTFALVNEYRGNGKTLYHFDMYRISGWDDLYSTGYFDYLDTGGCLIIEWSENIDYAIPAGSLFVKIERMSNDEGMRKITVSEDYLI